MYGSCCNEMDIWEANSVSASFSAHSCTVQAQTRCSGADCSVTSPYNGLCDPEGCDFNSFRMGDTDFYGSGLKINTSERFTVVTQFVTNDNTDTGNLTEIRRVYVQNGVIIENSFVNIPGIPSTDNSITDAYCTIQKSVFNETDAFDSHGGFEPLTQAFTNGVVLAMSIWEDPATQMLWLDGDYPANASASSPGVSRGTCPANDVLINPVGSIFQVVFSNIVFGDMGSSFSAL